MHRKLSELIHTLKLKGMALTLSGIDPPMLSKTDPPV